MSDTPSTNPFGNVPPWVIWVMLLGGGSGIGTLTGMEMGGGDHEDCNELERRVTEAEAARESMSHIIAALTNVIRQCNPATVTP